MDNDILEYSVNYKNNEENMTLSSEYIKELMMRLFRKEKDKDSEHFYQRGNDGINTLTFKFIDCALENIYDCKWIEICNSDYPGNAYALIGKTKTKRPHLAGYFIHFDEGG